MRRRARSCARRGNEVGSPARRGSGGRPSGRQSDCRAGGSLAGSPDVRSPGRRAVSPFRR
ncbi:hypothetical protein VT71_22525 [Burkholderia mallei]|nr:hypothetical protein VT71_22525 [Burkholderia mallei]